MIKSQPLAPIDVKCYVRIAPTRVPCCLVVRPRAAMPDSVETAARLAGEESLRHGRGNGSSHQGCSACLCANKPPTSGIDTFYNLCNMRDVMKTSRLKCLNECLNTPVFLIRERI